MTWKKAQSVHSNDIQSLCDLVHNVPLFRWRIMISSYLNRAQSVFGEFMTGEELQMAVDKLDSVCLSIPIMDFIRNKI